MATFPKNHSTLYFDALIRTQKAESLLSLIHATHHAKNGTKNNENLKKNIAERLKFSYGLFRENVRGYENGCGSYGGTEEQFQSQYTLGHEMAIWLNSDLDLNPLAKQVAENNITIKNYLDRILLNYVQPINESCVHPLYSVLKYINENGEKTITKEEVGISLNTSTQQESLNALYYILTSTSYFNISDKDEMTYVYKESIEKLMSQCNLRYIGSEGYKLAKNELTEDEYNKYIISTHADENVDSIELNVDERYILLADDSINEEDFCEWLKTVKNRKGDVYDEKMQEWYFNCLKNLPSLSWGVNIFDIKNIEDLQEFKSKLTEATPKYDDVNSASNGGLGAVLKVYEKYLLEKNCVNITEDRLVEILKDWLDKEYVKSTKKADNGNITSTLVGFGFKYARAIRALGLTSSKLKIQASGKEDMHSLIDRGVDLYYAIANNSIGFAFESKEKTLKENFNFNSIKNAAENKIFFGVPGCGKSFHIEHTILGKEKGTEKYKNYAKVIRTTFYQDYSNTDFVGQILPKISKDENGKDIVEYIFNPGPFTLALIQAISNPTEKVALVVEEINRGNAPAIFGDIFQLLDRDENSVSEYGIVNVGIIDYLNNYEFTIDGKKVKYHFEEIKIPGNLDILATMNTSDQNVYTLDTAFTRRWSKERIPNKFKGHKIEKMFVPGMSGYTWGAFVDGINDRIKDSLEALQINEDKQVGAFFINERDLINVDQADSDQKKKAFAYKVLEYLWEDVSKLDHDRIFNSYKTFEDLVDKYITEGISVFNSDTKAKIDGKNSNYKIEKANENKSEDN